MKPPDNSFKPTPMTDESRRASQALRLLCTPADMGELLLVRSLLDANGITYFIENEGLGSLLEGPALPLVNQRRVMVPAEQYSEASEILEMSLLHPNRCVPESAPSDTSNHTKLRVLAVILFGIAVLLLFALRMVRI